MPPSILNPTSDNDNTPIYNQEHSLTCEVTGKLQVDVTWLKNDDPVTGFKPQIDTEISISDGPYDLTTGVQSTLPWNPQGSEGSCETVTKYDGNYRCMATNTGPDGGERDKLSAVIKLTTKCEYFKYHKNILKYFYSFIYSLGVYVTFNTVQFISRWVVLLAEKTSTHSWSWFCTLNCQPLLTYQFSHIRLGECVTTVPPWSLIKLLYNIV